MASVEPIDPRQGMIPNPLTERKSLSQLEDDGWQVPTSSPPKQVLTTCWASRIRCSLRVLSTHRELATAVVIVTHEGTKVFLLARLG